MAAVDLVGVNVGFKQFVVAVDSAATNHLLHFEMAWMPFQNVL